jgi:hypothetical protein
MDRCEDDHCRKNQKLFSKTLARTGRAPVDYRDGYESKPGLGTDRKSDNKKVSFDRAVLFELLMIPMQL